MYCTNCGIKLKIDDKFCSNCGSKIQVLANKSENKTKSNRVELDNEKVTIKYSESDKNIAGKLFGAIILSAIVGFFTYGISNQLLGINETDIRYMNLPPGYNAASGKDHFAFMQSYVKSMSFDYALYASVGFLIIALIFVFLNFEKSDSKENPNIKE